MVSKEEFIKELRQDVERMQLAKEEGGNKEQVFTRKVTDLLKLRDETNTVSVAFDEETNRSLKPHKVNGYSISDDSSQLDLFITIYKPKASVELLSASEIKDAFCKLRNFYDKATKGNYAAVKGETIDIYDCAYALGNDDEVIEKLEKVRFVLLTNAIVDSSVGSEPNDGDRKIVRKVVDLNRIMEMSQAEDEPIIVDFKAMDVKIQAITEDNGNDTYQTYLAILPGYVLADLYDKYRTRLMQSNVRQFLQFTGKVNKGIKTTIDERPEMFLAFNNGIAATATSITMDKTGRYIERINDLQIVNGGQTTASLYHGRSDNNKEQFNRISVQMKLSVIKKMERYDSIVSDIARYANNQNKVNEADLYSNADQMVRIEMYSRRMVVEPNAYHNTAYYWFFERVRGQYNNLMYKEGFKKELKNKFDLTYPKEQMFTKYDLAKFVCTFGKLETADIDGEILTDLTLAPYVACYGNEKVFDYYRKHYLPKDANEIDNVYFEDVIAKAIVFMDANRRYGTKRNGGIGDLKKTVVPYALSILSQAVGGRIDWYKIWQRQSISEEMSDLIFDLMKQVHKYIQDNSPLDRYDEWGKKESCWEELKQVTWGLNINRIKDDLYPEGNPPRRKIIEFEEIDEVVAAHQREIIESIPKEIWEQINEWADSTGAFNASQKINSKEIMRKVANGIALSDEDVERAIMLRDIVAQQNINILYNSDAYSDEEKPEEVQVPKSYNSTRSQKVHYMTDGVLRKMWNFEREKHLLPSHQDQQLNDYFTGKKELTFNMKLALFFGLVDLQKKGFLKDIDTSEM